MVAMSDFSTFSQMTWMPVSDTDEASNGWRTTYRDAVSVFLSNAVGFGLALLQLVLVLELGSHVDGVR